MNKTLHPLHSTQANPPDTAANKSASMFINFSTDTISIAIYQPEKKQFNQLSSYSLPLLNLPDAAELTQLLNSLGKTPSDVHHLIFSSPKHSLIPLSLYDETKQATYLSYLNDISPIESIYSHPIPRLNAILLTTIDNQLLKIHSQAFPNAKLHHHLQIFLEYILQQPHENETNVYIYFRKNSFDLAVQHQNSIRLLNTFTFETREDVAYHVLNVYQQLKLNNTTVPAILMGEIMQQSPVFEILYRYIIHVDIWNTTSPVINGLDFTDLPMTYYFTLINMPLCV